MPLNVKVGGVWKTVSTPSIKVSGTWRTVQGGWVKVAGTWRQFYSGLPSLGATLNTVSWLDSAPTPTNVSSGIQIHSDGTVDRLKTSTFTNQYTWLTGGGVNSDYECRMTTVTGTTSSGDTLNTWLSLVNTRNFNRNRTTDVVGTDAYVGTLEIQMAASPFTVLATATVTLTATVDA